MRVFVTGATGFVGGNLIRELIDCGFTVRVLSRKESDRRNFQGLSVDVVEGSLSDEATLYKAMQDCQWVFHAAAHYSLNRRDSQAIYSSNLEGTRTLLKAAYKTGVKRIVYTSSVAAIGLADDGKIADEQTTTTVEKLVSHYKKSKFLAEQLAKEAARDGLPVVIVNPSTPIGAHDVKPTPTGSIVLRFLRHQMPFYVHTGLNLVDVRDVCKGHILAAERGRVGERYILGNRNVTLKEMLDILAKITGLQAPKNALPHWIPIAVGYIDELLVSPLLRRSPTVTIDSAKMARHPMYYSSEKAIKELGLPQTPIEEALKSAVDWFKNNCYV